MNTEPVKVSACLEKATTMKDGSVRLTFDTQELTPERCASIFSLKNQMGWLIFCASSTEEIELPTEMPMEFKDQKTPSQRLRAVLFVEWSQLGKIGDFDSYYKRKMESFIQGVKDGLDDIKF